VGDVHTVRYVRAVRYFRGCVGCVVCCDSPHTDTYLKPKKQKIFIALISENFAIRSLFFFAFVGTEVEHPNCIVLYCIVMSCCGGNNSSFSMKLTCEDFKEVQLYSAAAR
jgi:hypothetical protein